MKACLSTWPLLFQLPAFSPDNSKEGAMSRVNVTIEVDLPDGVELLEYERHGDGHAFHVAWTLPDQCRCDRCGHEEPICLDAKNTFYTVRDLDLWGQPSFWIYQPPRHHCPHGGRRQHLLPPFNADFRGAKFRDPLG